MTDYGEMWSELKHRLARRVAELEAAALNTVAVDNDPARLGLAFAKQQGGLVAFAQIAAMIEEVEQWSQEEREEYDGRHTRADA